MSNQKHYVGFFWVRYKVARRSGVRGLTNKTYMLRGSWVHDSAARYPSHFVPPQLVPANLKKYV